MQCTQHKATNIRFHPCSTLTLISRKNFRFSSHFSLSVQGFSNFFANSQTIELFVNVSALIQYADGSQIKNKFKSYIDSLKASLMFFQLDKFS